MRRPRLTPRVIRAKPTWWWAAAQLTAIGMYVPLLVLSRASGATADPLSALLVGSVVSAALLGIYAVLAHLSGRTWKALAWVSIAGVFFWHWQTDTGLSILAGWVLTSLLFLLAAWGVGQVADIRLIRIGLFASAVSMATTLSVLAVLHSSEAVVRLPVDSSVGVIQSRPDVVLLLLDGYGRADVVLDHFGFDNQVFLDELGYLGFEVAEEATSSYNMTFLSVSSLLSMEPVHTDGSPLAKPDQRALSATISGENRVVSLFKGAGYTYIHGGLGHWINNCGPNVDVCLDEGQTVSSLVDLWTVFPLVGRTPFAGLVPDGGLAPRVSSRRLDQLLSWDELQGDDPNSPTFAFLHLLLPHPPMVFNAECQPRGDGVLTGSALNPRNADSMEAETRRDAWVEQLQCVNRTVLSFLGKLDRETVVIVASDHGPDSTYHLDTELPRTAEQIRERFSILLAVRLLGGCPELPTDAQLHDVFGYLFGCLTGEEYARQDKRQFYVSGFTGQIRSIEYPGN